MLKPRITLKQLAWSTAFLLALSAMLLAWSAVRQQESTLAIRAIHQGASMPDGFSIWHHLDANGIRFKSITPKNDTLLITFGYIIAQQDDNNQAVQWLSRLRDTSHRVG
ncbi:EnvZ/OmpR regulon moderator MzrA [Citrobacter farmeri]|uniref:EnvZ/OmpR regulon moderator MzrA n=1 Tax=Citrobacter farmeri TaxID=67824 RepID=UPI002930E2DB|nr:EnvZ/OmpR regulon moderator MzrA [Citrobacter farmeri]